MGLASFRLSYAIAKLFCFADFKVSMMAGYCPISLVYISPAPAMASPENNCAFCSFLSASPVSSK